MRGDISALIEGTDPKCLYKEVGERSKIGQKENTIRIRVESKSTIKKKDYECGARVPKTLFST
jgi:hypothetical protein